MRQLLVVVVLSVCSCATTYYVSSSSGSDGNNGTSTVTPWKTLAKVNGASFGAGDAILLARGDVWNESLVPPSSGVNGNPISFDAYGSGAAPEIRGKVTLTNWTQYATNVWSAPLGASGLSYVLFDTIWGQKQSSIGALAHDRDFMLWSGALYVFAPSNPGTYYGTVSAIVPLNAPASDQAIYINGKSWLVFQHIKLDWFDQFGVNVTGSSDHLVFANMESDGMVPAGPLPHGFYVNAASPTDIQFINVDASMNYDGFRFDGGLSAASIVNAKGYFNRNYGIDNTTSGQVTYSYSHFYGNGIAVLGSTDPMDAIGALELGGAGNGHNIASYTAPTVNNFARYPARISYTIDDEGKSPGGADYIDSLLPQFASRNLKLSIAVVTGEQYANGDVPRIQGWFGAGHDINSHSWSHTRCKRLLMTIDEQEVLDQHARRSDVATMFVRVVDHEFQREVLEKLGRLEANVEMLVGDGQPGRMKMAEDKIFALQRSDIRRGVYDRIVNAVIATAISIVVALHDHLGLK